MAKRPQRRTAGVRGARLEELIREEINSLLDDEIGDARLQGAQVTLVELSGDGSRARLWIALPESCLPEEEHVRALTFATGFLRRRLCAALPLKRVPELRFRLVPSAGGLVEDERDSS